ncbi:MAG: hypothetical protein QXH80_00095 [Candidatus Nanoarchaeia archaeon]
MTTVDANKKLSDPIKLARLLYVLEPLLEDKLRFERNVAECEKLLEIANMMTKKRIISPLRDYRTWNSIILDELPKFSHLEFIATTAETPDLGTDEISYLCVDPISPRNRLFGEIIRAENEVFADFDLKQSKKHIFYAPISPCLITWGQTAYKDNQVIYEMPWEKLVSKFNAQSPADKIRNFKDFSWTRGLGHEYTAQKGFFEFHVALFKSGLAEKFEKRKLSLAGIPPEDFEEVLESKRKEVRLSRQVAQTAMAQALKTAYKTLGVPQEHVVYAKETSYVSELYKKLYPQYKKKNDMIIRDTKGEDLRLAECKPSAIAILKNYISTVRYGNQMPGKLSTSRGPLQMRIG